jgi:DNA-directed RNA polymerase specialized sigma24 family protein
VLISKTGRNAETRAELHGATATDAEPWLRETMALLDGVDRRTREMHIAHRSGWTYAEIGAFLGLFNRKVKKCVARALLAIMENLERAREKHF